MRVSPARHSSAVNAVIVAARVDPDKALGAVNDDFADVASKAFCVELVSSWKSHHDRFCTVSGVGTVERPTTTSCTILRLCWAIVLDTFALLFFCYKWHSVLLLLLCLHLLYQRWARRGLSANTLRQLCDGGIHPSSPCDTASARRWSGLRRGFLRLSWSTKAVFTRWEAIQIQHDIFARLCTALGRWPSIAT